MCEVSEGRYHVMSRQGLCTHLDVCSLGSSLQQGRLSSRQLLSCCQPILLLSLGQQHFLAQEPKWSRHLVLKGPGSCMLIMRHCTECYYKFVDPRHLTTRAMPDMGPP